METLVVTLRDSMSKEEFINLLNSLNIKPISVNDLEVEIPEGATDIIYNYVMSHVPKF